ncbi:hypothetical protein EYW49_17560 [Siculibacillus lacustris]|uniref:Uncharacterized protein n=1 Tax=Siculibacillus lacustris TaxID=1549641 RepID=A0A4Q9VJU7_9HYPH|nr:hypothetical protein [Siculibacillus lacustris]TBW34728.1 hypothetical protein EYW49_17560 [Siculibacillus lacustris]
MLALLRSCLVVVAFALPPVAMALWPHADSAVVVIGTAPAGEVVATAAGTLLGLSDSGRTAVTRAARPDDTGFLARLRAAGARLVLAAPDDLACLTTKPRHAALSMRN